MKNRRKRVVSALLVIALLVTFLPVIPKENVLSYAADVSKVTRGVVERIEQLPQYQNENYLSLKKGTEKRPFVVLEIVPYEEMAEFGYQIGGCEPVAVEQMYGRGKITTVGSLADAVVTQQTAYFFSDEPEGDEQNYDVVDGKCNLRACEERRLWMATMKWSKMEKVLLSGSGRKNRYSLSRRETGISSGIR